MSSSSRKKKKANLKKHPIIEWLLMPTQDVLDRFASLPNAQKVGDGDEQFIYVPGTREDKVLLVAHSDTVWDDEDGKRSVKYSKGKISSNINGVGIGADDRAGTALLWQLKGLGHSLLIPNGEESGCKGSHFLTESDEWNKVIDEHRFAIEFDRRGSRDLCFYSVGSKKFITWCEENFKGYKEASGSWTDIGVLCKKITGVNISVGYYEQHMASEHLIEAQWYHTLNTVRSVLLKKDLPRFEQDPRPVYTNNSRNVNYSENRGRIGFQSESYGRSHRSIELDTYDSSDDYFKDKYGDNSSVATRSANHSAKYDTTIMCPECEMIMDESEFVNNNNECVNAKCKESFSIR
jgi:hypothetical protein